MKKKRPDLSQQEVTPQILMAMFPMLAPFERLLSTQKHTRSTAFTGILIELSKLILVASIFIAVMLVVSQLSHFFPGSGESNLLEGLAGIFVALPSMLAIILICNNIFDLFYLLVTGVSFAKGGQGLQFIKAIMLILGFVGSLVGAAVGYYHFSMYRSAKAGMNQLKNEQTIHLSYLSKGRAAWNEYITASPHHDIDLSYTDLSGKHFKGFYFYSVDFKESDLTNTVFEDCDLSYVAFAKATCKGTDFKQSYLKGAKFEDTDLSDAKLNGAFAFKGIFTKTKVKPEQLETLQDPEKSRWDEVSWYDFRSEEYLKKRGYSYRGKLKNLKY